MNLPIPEVSDYLAGFASCAALTIGAVLVRHAWPAITGAFGKAEAFTYAEYKAAVTAIDAKLNQLSNAAAGAINAVRGDIDNLQASIANLEDRAFTLEKAVGIPDPTKAVPQAAPAVQPAGPAIVDPSGTHLAV